MKVNGQVSKKLANLILCHFARMAFVVKEHIAFDPVYVSDFCLAAIMLKTNNGANLIQEFR